MKKQKGFVHIIPPLIIILIGLAVVGFRYKNYEYKKGLALDKFIDLPFFSLTPQVSPVSNPPLYSEKYYGEFINPYLHYSITLPENWYAQISNPKAGVLSETYISHTDFAKSEGNLLIQTEYLYKNKSFQENVDEWLTYYISSTSSLGNFQPKITDKKEILVGNNKAIRYTIDYAIDGKNFKAVWIYVPYSDDILLSIKYESDSSKLLEKFDQVISTFYFTDQQTINCLKDTDCPQGYKCSENCEVNAPGGADCQIIGPPPKCIKI